MSQSKIYEALPEDLQPPADKRSMGFKNGVQAAVDFVETMSTLPGSLKPHKGIHYTPPKFVYGWMMSNEEFCDFIETHYPQLVGMGIDDGEEYMDVRITMNLVRDYFVKELKIRPRWRPSLSPATYPKARKYEALILTDSYTKGNKVPKLEVVEKFKAFFHFKEEPRWFLHRIHYRWRRRHLYLSADGELQATIDC